MISGQTDREPFIHQPLVSMEEKHEGWQSYAPLVKKQWQTSTFLSCHFSTCQSIKNESQEDIIYYVSTKDERTINMMQGWQKIYENILQNNL